MPIEHSRMIYALTGENPSDLPEHEIAYFTELCDEWERSQTDPPAIHADPAFDDFHGHDRADERRWLEAEDEMDTHEYIHDFTGSN